MLTHTEKSHATPVAPRQRDDVARRLGAAGWGVFFLWVGYALMAGLSIGVGLLGVGAITLATQVARRAFGLPLEGFWIFAGSVMVAGGLWGVFALEIPMAPFVLVGLGFVLLLGAILGRRGSGDGT